MCHRVRVAHADNRRTKTRAEQDLEGNILASLPLVCLDNHTCVCRCKGLEERIILQVKMRSQISSRLRTLQIVRLDLQDVLLEECDAVPLIMIGVGRC